MPISQVVKVRKAGDNRFVAIPKSIAVEIKARYLRVIFDQNKLVYEPLSEVQ